MTEAIAVVSFDGFLDREQRSERRHELVGGRVYEMSGGSERHDLAAGFTYELLAAGALASGSRPFTSNRLVRTRSGNAYDAEATSLNLLVLVDPDTRRMELARPVSGAIDAWEVRGPGEVLATEFGDIDVDALYDSIDRTATTS